MNRLIVQPFVKAFTLALVVCHLSANYAQPATDDTAKATDDITLPKVEKAFSVVHFEKGPRTTFAKIVEPETVKRIILLHDHGIGLERNPNFDSDELFAQLMNSPTVSEHWGIDALERTVAEYVIITKKLAVFKITVLCHSLNNQPRVSGVLLYGKGFSCRFDCRTHPLSDDPSD